MKEDEESDGRDLNERGFIGVEVKFRAMDAIVEGYLALSCREKKMEFLGGFNFGEYLFRV